MRVSVVGRNVVRRLAFKPSLSSTMMRPAVWNGLNRAWYSSSVQTSVNEKATNASLRLYSRGEVAQHNKDDDLWIIIDEYVYDVTEWLNFHPGGRDILIFLAGKDATEHFKEIGHSQYAQEKMKQFRVGYVAHKQRFTGSEYEDRPGEV